MTNVTCKDEWLPFGITVDPISRLVLPIDRRTSQESKALHDWTLPIALCVGARALVTDAVDGFKTATDEVEVQHQVCKAYVVRNTEA